MSDFLARVAARAVGRAQAVRPRLPAAFEALPDAGAEIEPVEEEVPETQAARASDTARPPSSTAEAPSRRAPPGPQPQRRSPTAEPTPFAVAKRAAAGPAPPARRPPKGADPGAPREREPAPARALARIDRPATSVPDPRSTAAPPQGSVAAKPAVRASPEAGSRRAAAPRPAAARDQSPAVRVHIGRLEVRANLETAPAPTARREPEAPPSLSLADYLRGSREVG